MEIITVEVTEASQKLCFAFEASNKNISMTVVIGTLLKAIIGLGVIMSCMFTMIPCVYDDRMMTPWKEFSWFYVRLQGGSVNLQYILSLLLSVLKYGSSLELNLRKERLGLWIADLMFNSRL